MRTFNFCRLPAELKYSVLDNCDARTMTNLLLVSRSMNALAKESFASRIQNLVGDCEGCKERHLMLGVYRVDEESHQANWFDTAYISTNNSCNFHYTFDSSYSSKPTSASTSGASSPIPSEDDQQPRDLGVQSMFVLSEDGSHHEATIEISQDDNFAQIFLQIALARNSESRTSPPTSLFKTTQRIYKYWEGEDYLIHNHELTYRMKVQKTDEQPRQNFFGEVVEKYKVVISEIVLNSAYLMNKVQQASESKVIFGNSVFPVWEIEI